MESIDCSFCQRYIIELDATKEILDEEQRTCDRLVGQLSECKRSHPHENMGPMCELRTEIARLKSTKPQ